MPASHAHIAGVGLSSSANHHLSSVGVSACTKALLDAGITYSKVELSAACFLDEPQLRIPKTCFRAFGEHKAPVTAIDSHTALPSVAQWVRSGQVDCALVVGLDNDASMQSRESAQVCAVAIVLVSDLFLMSHAYLKDSAVTLKAFSIAPVSKASLAIRSALAQARVSARDLQIMEVQGTAASSSNGVDLLKREMAGSRANTSPARIPTVEGLGGLGWAGLCGMVWRLRGWTHERQTQIQHCLQCIAGSEDAGISVAILGRADGRAAPSYMDSEHLRDGRERLGYNPAEKEQDIASEDLEAVRTRAGDRRVEASAEEVQRIPLSSIGGDRAVLARL